MKAISYTRVSRPRHYRFHDEPGLEKLTNRKKTYRDRESESNHRIPRKKSSWHRPRTSEEFSTIGPHLIAGFCAEVREVTILADLEAFLSRTGRDESNAR